MRVDVNERRYLAAIRFVDATSGAPVRGDFVVDVPGTKMFQNRSGLYVIAEATGLEDHIDAFDAPPAAPDPGDLDFAGTFWDRDDLYLPRRFTFSLPRDPEGPLFAPIDVPLYPSPRAPSQGNWAPLRARLVAVGGGAPVGGALCRVVRRSDDRLLAVGMSVPSHDPRQPDRPRPTAGELLILVPGLEITVWGDVEDPVLVNEIGVRLEIVPPPAPALFPDPEPLLGAASDDDNEFELNLAAGRTHLAGELALAVP